MRFDYKNRKFSFGKFDYYKRGRRLNEVEIEVRLDEDEGRFRFAVCGDLWNSKKTDCIYGGQCLDTLKNDFPILNENPLFNTIYVLWQKCHLNYLDKIGNIFSDKIEILFDEGKSDSELSEIFSKSSFTG